MHISHSVVIAFSRVSVSLLALAFSFVATHLAVVSVLDMHKCCHN